MANYNPKGRERMAEIGHLGGLASAKTRERRFGSLERKLLGVIGARARWGKPKWSLAEEAAWREGWVGGALAMSGWLRDR
jgi:hypothetical protein